MRRNRVLGKRQLGVGRREAQFAILLAEFLLHLRRCQFATSTRQEVLRGEGASRTVVVPGAVEILLREFATTDDISVLFESKKVLTLFQTMAAVSGNSTAQVVGDISKNYDGVRVGFDLKK